MSRPFRGTGDLDTATGVFWPRFEADEEAVMELAGSWVPVAAKHFQNDRLDWVEAGLQQ